MKTARNALPLVILLGATLLVSCAVPPEPTGRYPRRHLAPIERIEITGPAPRAGMYWRKGRWVFRFRQWVWIPGQWVYRR